MFNKICVFLFFISVSVLCSFLDCPFGSSPIIDGNISSGEYSDAVYIRDPSQGSSMYLKHDGEYVYFAFDSVNLSYDVEHFFDTENDDASTPQTDDRHYGFSPYWIYEEQGNGFWFETVEIGGWSFSWSFINANLWRGEVAYSFQELGITNGEPDTLGMALFAGFNWGFGGFEPYNWGDFYSSSNWTGIIENNKKVKFSISQNPFFEEIEIFIDGEIDNDNIILEVYNLLGEKIKVERFKKRTGRILLKGDDNNGNPLPSGIYFLIIRYGDEVGKFILTKLKK